MLKLNIKDLKIGRFLLKPLQFFPPPLPPIEPPNKFSNFKIGLRLKFSGMRF
jgi:hypothetical protein